MTVVISLNLVYVFTHKRNLNNLLFEQKESVEQQIEEITVEDDFNLDMDFSKTKKKKKKKKDLDELVAEEELKEREDKENGIYHKK